MYLQFSFSRFIQAGFALLLVVLMPSSYAQSEIQEIMVTATLREESLQDVSMSIDVIDGAQFEEFAVSNFLEMQVPGVTIGQGTMNESAFIRGVGSTAGNFGAESSAPFYVDGVYFGKVRATRAAFLDVERMEVIKGPVPTYLGKNASAGAFSIKTRRPTDEFEAYIDVTNEFEADEMTVTGAISGPITDTFRVRLAGNSRDLSEGWMTNFDSPTGDMSPRQDDTVFRLSAEWDITDQVGAYVKYETMNNVWNGRNIEYFDCAAVNGAAPNDDCLLNFTRTEVFDIAQHPTGIWEKTLDQGEDYFNEFDYSNITGVLTWAIGDMLLTSTTAQYEFDNYFFSRQGPAAVNYNQSFEQTSQEVRLESAANEDVSWLIGAYYDTNDNVNSTAINLYGMGVVILQDNDEDADAWDLFGEVDVRINDELSATVGGRYTNYEKENVNNREFWVRTVAGQPYTDGMVNGMATFTVPSTHSDSAFSPSLGLEWRPTDNAMYFATYREGFKAGGIDHGAPTANPDLQVVDPESVKSVEVGARLTLLEGDATLNLTAFRSEYTDLQVSVYNPDTSSFNTSNAGSTITQGLELEGRLRLNDNWNINATLSLLDAAYDTYQGVQCYSVPAQTAAEGCLPVLDQLGAPTGALAQDLSGERTQFAPDYSGRVSLNYRSQITNDLELYGTASVFFSDDYVQHPTNDPQTVQPSYSTIDLRIGLGSAGGPWSIGFYGRNLTNELIADFRGNSANQGYHLGLLRRPKELGLQARYDF